MNTSLNALNFAVLDDLQMMTYSYQTQQMSVQNRTTIELLSLDALLDVAHANHLDTIWITPGSVLSRFARALITHEQPGLEMWLSKRKDGTPRFLMMHRMGSQPVKVAWPEWDDRWPWQNCVDSGVLFRSIRLCQEAVGAEIAWGPGRVGQELMIAKNQVHEQWLRPAHLPDVVKKHLAGPMEWKRPLTRDEKRMPMWYHMFDKGSQHLAACTSVLLGEGDPEHLIEDTIDGLTFKAFMPGVWNVEGMGWIWTPELEYQFKELEDLGALRPVIHEAYVWNKWHQLLRGWAEDLWLARMQLTAGYAPTDVTIDDPTARALAYQAVKPIYTHGLGWLAHPSKNGDNKLYRPDWWSMVVSTAHRAMGFKIRKLKTHGIYPAFVNVDAIGVVSEGESIVPYIPLILDNQGSLGGFRHVGSCIITPELASTFEDDVKFSQCHTAVLAALEG